MPFTLRPYRRFPVLAKRAHKTLSNLQITGVLNRCAQDGKTARSPLTIRGKGGIS